MSTFSRTATLFSTVVLGSMLATTTVSEALTPLLTLPKQGQHKLLQLKRITL